MKGIFWLPIAIGIVFLAQILIFSLMFTKVTVFSREVQDANILFEGDELETYARSLGDSVELSIVQSLYNFSLSHNGEVWQNYGDKRVPDAAKEIEGSVQIYSNAFLARHAEFSASVSDPGDPQIEFPASMGSLTMVLGEKKIDARFDPEIELKKTSVQFPVAEFKRSFVAETSFVTVFGEMMKVIRDNLIGGDKVTTYTLYGIGRGGGSATQCQASSTSVSGQRVSYIDDHTSGNRQIVSATQTRGHMDFCSFDTKFVCTKGSPNSAGTPRADPTADEVYSNSHGKSFGSGKAAMVEDVKSNLACLELELDEASEDYTVSFDDTENVKSEITSPSCTLTNTGVCACKLVGKCGSKTNPKKLYECNVQKRKTCDYSHFAEAEVTPRFQEDGFIYGFIDGKDSVKTVFKIVSGNMQGFSTPQTSISHGPEDYGLGSDDDVLPSNIQRDADGNYFTLP